MKKLDWIGMVIGFTGLGMIWYNYDWILALGIFLMLFGNNIQHNIKRS